MTQSCKKTPLHERYSGPNNKILTTFKRFVLGECSITQSGPACVYAY